MKVRISKSKISGSIRAPASKSYTIRGLMCAALAKGWSELYHPLIADDTEAAMNVLRQIGVKIQIEGDLWRIGGGDFCVPAGELFCRDSAATLRFMTAIGTVIPGKITLTAGPSLAKRPVDVLAQALRQLGADVSCTGGVPPVTLNGGVLKGGVAKLRGDISSQYISALLLVSPLAENGVSIQLTTPLESRSYVRMTLEALTQFGIETSSNGDLSEYFIASQSYQPAEYTVEGDWSSASYLLALGAVAGKTITENLNTESVQGDRIITSFLRDMGASVKTKEGAVIVRKQRLHGIHADLNECIDLLPTMTVLAALAQGTSEFTGIRRARLKESDRIAALHEGLAAAGIEVVETEDSITITGGKIKPAALDSKMDHRVAMAFSILGAAKGGIEIKDAECVSKTFPDFWNTLKSIGGEVQLYE